MPNRPDASLRLTTWMRFQPPPETKVRSNRLPKELRSAFRPWAFGEEARIASFDFVWSILSVAVTTLFIYAAFRPAGNDGAAADRHCLRQRLLLDRAPSCYGKVGAWEARVGHRGCGDRLMVVQTGLRGTRRHEWSNGEITTVHVGPSGLSIDKQPVVELQIVGEDGKLFGALAGRDEQNCSMATVLRKTLKTTVPSTQGVNAWRG